MNPTKEEGNKLSVSELRFLDFHLKLRMHKYQNFMKPSKTYLKKEI